MELVSVQIGTVRQSQEGEEVWRSAIWKESACDVVSVGELGLAGDEHADLKHHGGPDKAILAYSDHHFERWRSWLGADVPPGSFGENFTVHGVDETVVCVGDIWRCGTLRLQVSQPRQPCWKLGRRWERPELVKEVLRTHAFGWYLRVLSGGELSVDLARFWELDQRPQPDWTVARASDIYHSRRRQPQLASELRQVAELAAAWRETLP